MSKTHGSFQLSQSEVCCISDIHIGVHQNGSMWHDIALEWSTWLHDELTKKDIKDIIICGDLFHYRDEIAVNTIHVVNEILKNWSKFNIIILAGNHDSFYKDRVDVNSLSILDGWSNITIIDKPTVVETLGRKLLFCPWGTKPEELVECDIMFGHFEIVSFKMNHFKVCTEGIRTGDLLDKSDLVITGHFHHRDERKYEEGDILYLGNPFQMDFGDANTKKGYYILDTDKKTYEFHENKISPKHHKIKLSTIAQHGTIIKSIQQKLHNNIVRLIIDLHIMADEVEILLQSLFKEDPKLINVEYAINFNKFGIGDENEYDLSGVDISTAIKEFINLLEIDNKDEVLDFTMDLYKKTK